MVEGKRIEIDEYLSKYNETPAKLAEEVRKIILELRPDFDEVVKWGYLVYEAERKMCSIMVHKKHINLQIWKGVQIEDPENKLQGEGKDMRHVKIHTPEDINKDYFRFLLNQAFAIS